MCENTSSDITFDQCGCVHGTPPFTMTSFQSAYGQVVAWCEYLSRETDGRIASKYFCTATLVHLDYVLVSAFC